MPSFVEMPSGNVRVIGKIKGKQYAKTLRTKKDCKAWWALQVERLNESTGELTEGKTLLDALARYAKEITPKKKGHKQELNRIKFFISENPELVAKRLTDISIQDTTAWRNKRFKNGAIKASTLIKESSLLSGVFNACMQEWFWCKHNPFKGLKMPKKPAPRDRILSPSEIEKMQTALGFSFHERPDTIASRVGAIMLFAIETAMRSSEICHLRWQDLSHDGKIAHIADAKTRAGIRDVPLSSKAQAIIQHIKSVTAESQTVFNVTDRSRDAIFRKARQKARLHGFTFHDTQATALTHLAKVLNPYELTKMVGHSDFNEIMTYYRESAHEIGKKLK